MSEAIRQHYVPRFLLKNFTRNESNQLFVYDKKKERSFKASAKNIAVEKNFYDINIKGYKLTIEPSLADLECESSKIIDKIISNKSLKDLSTEERAIISSFISVQYLRTHYFRINTNIIFKKIRDKFISMGADEDQLEDFSQLNEKELKMTTINFIEKNSHEFSRIFFQKEWILLETDEKKPFIISDHPVSLSNQNDLSPYGNLGFGVKGVEIYLPISEKLTIYIMCPFHTNEIRKTYHWINLAKKVCPELPQEVSKEQCDYVEKLFKALKNGNTIFLNPENVRYNNHLQVYYSNRWIITPDGDFDLVKEMVDDIPDLKDGPGITIKID